MTKTNFLLVLLFFVNSFLFSQTQKEIDSINNLYTQGLNIPQDSIISLFQKNLSDASISADSIGTIQDTTLSKVNGVFTNSLSPISATKNPPASLFVNPSTLR